MHSDKKKVEKSTVFCIIAIFAGVGSIVAYWVAVFVALGTASAATIDAAVATSGMTTVVGALLSYCLYQYGLKNSRNKYGVDSEGQPFMRNDSPDQPETPAEES